MRKNDKIVATGEAYNSKSDNSSRSAIPNDSLYVSSTSQLKVKLFVKIKSFLNLRNDQMIRDIPVRRDNRTDTGPKERDISEFIA